jgi:hypothetical protein
MFNQPRPFRLYGIKLPLITSVSPSFSLLISYFDLPYIPLHVTVVCHL